MGALWARVLVLGPHLVVVLQDVVIVAGAAKATNVPRVLLMYLGFVPL